ncbi:3D domain-containing protein [Bacillus testis]|uniref:3D domain-containing protein n=1 Tax=Bacillus testis TaxID=1622072 RepID=UPI00067ED0A3|nr:3D domain-containing protein [Bacillus testis]
MKKTLLSFLAAATISTTVGMSAHASEIVVKDGDTLSGLSKQHGVTVNDIKQWNGLSSDLILVDQKLSISPEQFYSVVEGDSLWSIAQEFGVTVSQLQAWNKMSGDMIFPRQQLVIKEAHKAASIAVKQPANNQINQAQEQQRQAQAQEQQRQAQAQEQQRQAQLQEQQRQAQAQEQQRQAQAQEQQRQAQAQEQQRQAQLQEQQRQAQLQEQQRQAQLQEQQRQAQLQEQQRQAQAQEQQRQAQAQQQQPTSGTSMTVTATAYTADCAGCSGITATGVNLKSNPNAKVIAVDPSVIPLGSKVYVEGYGYATAADTGGAIKGNKIDVLVPSQGAATQWGVKQVNIKIVD